MDAFLIPDRCLLCNHTDGLASARFRQVYRQVGCAPVYLTWWECTHCRGWFLYPVPSPEVIVRGCAKAGYNDSTKATDIAQAKDGVHHRILSILSEWTRQGALLDFGCSFGQFLSLAHQGGWAPTGFDANETAVEMARSKGFQVYYGWELESAEFSEGKFAAITAVDSFCYVWDPYRTLQLFQHILQPGGVLAMRLTNKRCILGVARSLCRSASRRDKKLSPMLQGQFHTISMKHLRSILHHIGFQRVRIEPGASTALWRDMSYGARLAYLLGQFIYGITFGRVNISPGVLVFAQKAQ